MGDNFLKQQVRNFKNPFLVAEAGYHAAILIEIANDGIPKTPDTTATGERHDPFE